MATKVAKTGVERESGWLYFLDKKGNVSRVRMARGGGKVRKTKPQVVAKAGVTRESGRFRRGSSPVFFTTNHSSAVSIGALSPWRRSRQPAATSPGRSVRGRKGIPNSEMIACTSSLVVTAWGPATMMVSPDVKEALLARSNAASRSVI